MKFGREDFHFPFSNALQLVGPSRPFDSKNSAASRRQDLFIKIPRATFHTRGSEEERKNASHTHTERGETSRKKLQVVDEGQPVFSRFHPNLEALYDGELEQPDKFNCFFRKHASFSLSLSLFFSLLSSFSLSLRPHRIYEWSHTAVRAPN